MHYTDKIIILTLLLFTVLGCLLLIFPPLVNRAKPPVFVSDRIESCEKAGGRYSLNWAEWRNEYYEGCETVEVKIENF